VAAGFAVAAVVVYAADGAGVWLRTLAHRDPTGTVPVAVMLAVPQKNGRIEFIPSGTVAQACIHAAFPHYGLNPCWFVEGHTRRTVRF
jgi:hypothetical protein